MIIKDNNKTINRDSVIDYCNSSIYWKDKDGYYLGCNQYTLELLGYTDEADIIGKTDYDFFSTAEADKIRKTDHLALENKLYYGEEKVILNGKCHTFINTKKAIFDAEDNVIGICGNCIDITEIKNKFELEKQQLLDQEEYKIRQIIDNVDASIYWKDTEGRILGCNKYVLNMFDVDSINDLLGKNEYDLLTEDEAKKFSEIDQHVFKYGFFKGEETGVFNGKRLHYQTAKNRLFDNQGNIIGTIGMSIDITAQKEAERLRLENEQHLAELNLQKAIAEERYKVKQIIDNVDASIYWKDLHGRILGCNNHVLKLLGAKSIDDLIGKNEYDLFSKEEAMEFTKTDQHIFKYGYYKGEESATPADGKKVYYMTAKNRLLDSEGNIIGTVGMSIDITAQKEAELLRRENEDHKIIEAEQEKFRKIIGQMIHDIQSPLSSLSSLLNETVSKLPENDRTLIRTALNSITSIISYILNKYKNNSDVADEQKQPVMVSEILLQSINEKSYQYRNQPIEFTTKFSKDTEFSFIRIEPIAFKRMLSNVINNAVDALENKPEGKIELKLLGGHEDITICIKDNGKGMPKEVLNKIREGIKVSAGKQNGHGLGLTQVWETLNHNNGTLIAYSDADNGTRIMLKFPLINKPTWIADKVKVIKGDTIIVLDDDESIHLAWDKKFQAILEQQPEIKIVHYTDGMEVINFINSLADDEKTNICLLTDYELLGQQVNGINVIKQTGIKRTLLVTSHYADPKIRDLAIDNQVKLLPKNLAFAVKIKIDKKLEPAGRKVDMVWLDDDKGLVKGIVEVQYSHLQVDIYDDPIGFLEDVHQYPLNTRIILDHYYYSFDIGCELDGIKVAQILHEKGYTNLLLITGTEPHEELPAYLKFILKKDIEKLNSLDKIN